MNQSAVFHVKDYLSADCSHSDAIDACLKAAATAPSRTIVFDGQDFWIDRAILLPSHTKVIIDNCAICQKDEVFDNVFRGDNCEINPEDPWGAPLSFSTLEDICIEGVGQAKILGTGKPRIGFHPVLNEYQFMTGDFWGWRTHMFSISLCDGFELSGVSLSQTMCWAVTFDHCCNVNVHDVHIFSLVKNGDGIDFRPGCHHCTVKNITGYTSDDTVACTAVSPTRHRTYPQKNYLYTSEPYSNIYPESDHSIHDIHISDIHTGGLHHGVICLSAEGNKVHHITVENIRDTSEGHQQATVKVYTGYGDNFCSGDIHHLTIRNVESNISKFAVMVDAQVEELVLENLIQNNSEGTPTNL